MPRRPSKNPPLRLEDALSAAKSEGLTPVAIDVHVDGTFRIWFSDPPHSGGEDWAPYGTGEFTL